MTHKFVLCRSEVGHELSVIGDPQYCELLPSVGDYVKSGKLTYAVVFRVYDTDNGAWILGAELMLERGG